MIKVDRGLEPPILRRNKRNWLREYKAAIRAYTKNPSQNNERTKNNREQKYRHTHVQEALKDMFSGKCAYCESDIRHVTYINIEHFRPKSKFPDLCFEWDNLLLSCPMCNNRQYKGDNFPEAAEGGPLINPVDEDPEDFLNFEYDPDTKTASVFERNGNVRGRTTIRIIGLNRYDLVRHRSKIVKMIAFIAINASQGNKKAHKELNEICSKENEYSAFARSFKRRFGL